MAIQSICNCPIEQRSNEQKTLFCKDSLSEIEQKRAELEIAFSHFRISEVHQTSFKDDVVFSGLRLDVDPGRTQDHLPVFDNRSM